jgi:hypothetical protein
MSIRQRTRGRYCLRAYLLLAAVPVTIRAQTVEAPKPKELSISPATVPSPVFKYRLLPLTSELQPGDAAPIYMRLKYEYETRFKEGLEKVKPWLEMPLAELPIKEAREWDMRDRLRLLEIGTRRAFCDWSYPLPEQKLEAFDILLPEVQAMRDWGRFLALKARLDIAEHKYEEAVRTIETGIALGRHVGEGPFLINALVGLAICDQMMDRLEELVAQPLTPNLYWALTALPRPLVSTRKSLELERSMPEDMIPGLTQLDSPENPAEWEGLLKRIYSRMQNLAAKFSTDVDGFNKATIDRSLAEFKKEAAPYYRSQLKDTRILGSDGAKAMSDDEVICRGLVAQYHILQDQVFKAIYLPYPDAVQVVRASEATLKEAKLGPLTVLSLLHPAVVKAMTVETRLDRRIAALRIIEAIRQYTGTHENTLPETLSQITEVPIPDDPATGKQFRYHLEQGRAIIPGPPEGLPGSPLEYRITIRNKVEPKTP